MQLIATKEFNGIMLYCYQEHGQEDKSDFQATREQIGKLLDYENPSDAIRLIHTRNKERLDKFSTTFKLNHVEGERIVSRDVIMYCFRGLLEICRYSNQPKANAVMDFLYDIADEIRRNGSYSVKENNSAIPSGAMEGALLIFNTAGISGNQAALALDRVYRSYTGRSALETGEVTLIAPSKHQLLTPSDIGKHFGLKAKRVNQLLAAAGFQHKINGQWEPLRPADGYAVMLDVGKRHSNGTAVRQLKWNSDILEVFRDILVDDFNKYIKQMEG